MARWLFFALVATLGCGTSGGVADAAADTAAPDSWMEDSGSVDASAPPTDSGVSSDAGPDAAPRDAGPVEDTLSAQRARLFATLTDDPCGEWSAMDPSARAVFDTLTHRLYLSKTPDGQSMLSHLETLYAVLGGGSDGTSCGGSENNRIFASMDVYLWERMIAANGGVLEITDGGDGYWARSGDISGPHDPFDASNETQTGLDCILLIESRDSRPPTGQAHFFRPGSETTIVRGAVEIAPDPRALEVDLDFDCLHQSNPTCRDFEERYRDGYGDFACDWVPPSCTADGTACYPAALAR